MLRLYATAVAPSACPFSDNPVYLFVLFVAGIITRSHYAETVCNTSCPKCAPFSLTPIISSLDSPLLSGTPFGHTLRTRYAKKWW